MSDDGDGRCTKCGHHWGSHVLMATMVTAEHGGLVFCHTVGCMCQSSWSVEGNPLPYIPDVDEIDELRAIAQSDEPESEDVGWPYDDDRGIELD